MITLNRGSQKKQTRDEDYLVINVHHNELGDTTEFHLPGTHLATRVEYLETHGWLVVQVIRCDRERYINERINQTVREYTYEDTLIELSRQRFKRGEIDVTTYMETVRLAMDYKMTCLKILYDQMRRLRRYDYDCTNEVAIQLCDQVFGPIF